MKMQSESELQLILCRIAKYKSHIVQKKLWKKKKKKLQKDLNVELRKK